MAGRHRAARRGRAASSNPADLLGLTDRGRLAPGLRADIVVLGAETLSVRRVLREGEQIAGDA